MNKILDWLAIGFAVVFTCSLVVLMIAVLLDRFPIMDIVYTLSFGAAFAFSALRVIEISFRSKKS